MLSKNAIDLMLLDMNMAKVDGLRVIQEAKKNSPKTRILVITGFADTYQDKAKELGVDGFFIKPVRLDSIVKRITELLEKKSPPCWPWQAKAEEIGERIIQAKALFIEDPNPNPPFIPLDDMTATAKIRIKAKFIYSQKEQFPRLESLSPI